jgi:hypothetical protein
MDEGKDGPDHAWHLWETWPALEGVREGEKAAAAVG